jgi:hypothetical protein
MLVIREGDVDCIDIAAREVLVGIFVRAEPFDPITLPQYPQLLGAARHERAEYAVTLRMTKSRDSPSFHLPMN